MKNLIITLLLLFQINLSWAIDEEPFDISQPAKIQEANAEFVYKFLLAEIAEIGRAHV